MENTFMGIYGYVLILIAGIFSGIFTTPFSGNKSWRWENNWFIWSLVALVVCPWIISIMTVPDIFHIYGCNVQSTILVAFFGFIWGIGAILFGRGIDYLGVSLGIPIMQGLINSVGTIVPFLVNNKDGLLSPKGVAMLSGVILIVIGIVFFGIAGKEKEHKNSIKSGFKKGLFVCIMAGILGPMINFAFVFGEELKTDAIKLGVSELNSANVVWSITLTMGFIANILYCIYLLKKNNGWKLFVLSKPKPFILASLAGILWYVSILFYGMGCNSIGENASSIGWAVMQATGILASNFAGIILGEWKTASRSAIVKMIFGILFLLFGVIVISY